MTPMTIFSETTWGEVCHLALGLTNPSSEGEEIGQFREGLAYMADHSIGGREWLATTPVHEVRDRCHSGFWRGFQEEGTEFLHWESARSGAVLLAEKQEGKWTISFTGRTKPCGWGEVEMESRYILDFIKATGGWIHVSDPPTTEGKAILAARLRDALAFPLVEGAAEKIRAFAKQLDIEL